MSVSDKLKSIEVDLFKFRDTFEIWILSCKTSEQLDLMRSVVYNYIECAPWIEGENPIVVKDVLGYLNNLIDVHEETLPVVATGVV